MIINYLCDLLLQNVRTTITECTMNYYRMYNELLQNVRTIITKCTTTITKCTILCMQYI
jgi:hypothetical protein